jgi:hypothetical protein
MSVQQSAITNLGYDLVVGVSQTSMNGIMKTYYENAKLNQQTFYFMTNELGEKFMHTDESTALAALGGLDPFTISSWNGQGTMPDQVQQCVHAKFNAAFRFTPGDPDTSAYKYLTCMPEMSANEGKAVFNYTLCCSDIQIVYWDATDNQWVNYSQPSPATQIVEFAAYAVVAPKQVAYDPADATLPQDVKTQAEALQAANISFAIQQVPFQLDTMEPSDLAVLPFMPTLSPFYYDWLAPSFIYAYAQALESGPVFCHTIQQTNQVNQTILNPTNLQATVEQLVDASGNVIYGATSSQLILDSFNYICAINGSTPVPAQQFTWNWFDSTTDIKSDSSYNGAIAISKYTLGKVFYAQLKDYVQNNCWIPQINCTNINGTDTWSFSMVGAGELNADPVIKDNSSKDLLVYYYAPEPFTTYGVVNPKDYATITTSFQMEVSIKDVSTITVTQEAQFSYTICLNGEEPMKGVPLNTFFSEDYTVSVTGSGTLVFQAGTPTIQKMGNQGTTPYLTDAEAAQLQQAITTTESSMQSAGLTAESLGTTQQVIFPGGTVFSFYDVQFTPNNDLACKINYGSTS